MVRDQDIIRLRFYKKNAWQHPNPNNQQQFCRIFKSRKRGFSSGVRLTMILNRFTLIIATYERMGALLKNIAVWNGTGVSAIILDGSGSEYNFDEHKHKFDFEITYYWMPIGYQKRLLSSIDFVKTEFCAFLSDDDFFLINATKLLIEKLIQFPEYSVLAGQYGILNLCNNAWTLEYFKPWYLISNVEECNFIKKNAIHKVEEFCKNYSPNFYYAIWRTSEWKNVVQCSFSLGVPHWLSEFYHVFCIAFFAKGKIEAEMLYVRTGEFESFVKSNDYDFYAFFHSTKYEKEKRYAYSILEEHAAKHGLENYLQPAFDLYYEDYKQREALSRERYLQFTLPAVRRASWYGLKKVLPFSVIQLVRNVFGKNKSEVLVDSDNNPKKKSLQLSPEVKKRECVCLEDINRLEKVLLSK